MSRPQSAVKSSASQRQPPPPPAPISGAGAARMQSCPELAPPAMISLLATRPRSEVIAKTRDIASEVAARHAADVDASARFPHETFASLKAARLLSAAVPRELGGDGADMQELSASCMDLAQGCAASGMILAMHHIQVACIARHGLELGVLLALSPGARRAAAADRRRDLRGRHLGRHPVEHLRARAPADGRFKLDKDATTGRYGARRRRPAGHVPSQARRAAARSGARAPEQGRLHAHADDDLGHARHARHLQPGLQAHIDGHRRPDRAGLVRRRLGADDGAVLAHPVGRGLVRHRGRRGVARGRLRARRGAQNPGIVPPQATRLAEVSVKLQTMRNGVAAMAAEFDAITAGPNGRDALLTIGWALKMNNLKVALLRAVPAIVHQALQIVGISGYKNDGKFTIGRNYRDALAAALMISNDRILSKSRVDAAGLQGRVTWRPTIAASFYDGLVAHRLIVPVRVLGTFGRGAVFEDVLDALQRGDRRDLARRSRRALYVPAGDRPPDHREDRLSRLVPAPGRNRVQLLRQGAATRASCRGACTPASPGATPQG